MTKPKTTAPPMNTLDAQLPPLAQALGRLRQPRAWPYAPRPVLDPACPGHDLLRLMPEPALTGELPPAPPRPPAGTLPGQETARTYWFDL